MSQDPTTSTPMGEPSFTPGNYVAHAREQYLVRIIRIVGERCGKCPQGKGIVQEALFADRLNANVASRSKGITARFSRSKTATGADIVQVQRGVRGLVRRYQVKDVTSPSGIARLKRQIAQGKYRNTVLVGSPETVAAYTKAGGQKLKRMVSTGISSTTTERVASNAGCQVRGNVVKATLTEIGKGTGEAAAVTGAIQTVMVTYRTINAVKRGESVAKSVRAGVTEVVATTANSAVTTSAALALRHGAHQLAQRTAKEGLKSFLKSNGLTTLIFAGVDQVADTVRYRQGKIDRAEYHQRTCGNAGGATGSVAGATLGTFIAPGLGTIVGGLLGGVLGQFGATAAHRNVTGRGAKPDGSIRWGCANCGRTMRQKSCPDQQALGPCSSNGGTTHCWEALEHL